MQEEEQKLFNALEVMRNAAWSSFDKRRSYEWKFGIALWTALAVFTGTLLTQPAGKAFPLRGWHPVLYTGLFGLAVVLVHAFWSRGISRANAADRNVSYVYETRMCPLVGVSRTKEILPLQPRGAEMGTLRNYSHASQVSITFLLALAATLAMWVRVSSVNLS